MEVVLPGIHFDKVEGVVWSHPTGARALKRLDGKGVAGRLDRFGGENN